VLARLPFALALTIALASLPVRTPSIVADTGVGRSAVGADAVDRPGSVVGAGFVAPPASVAATAAPVVELAVPSSAAAVQVVHRSAPAAAAPPVAAAPVPSSAPAPPAPPPPPAPRPTPPPSGGCSGTDSSPPPCAPPSVSYVESLIVAAARRHGVDENWMLRIADCESGDNAYAINRSGPYDGLFQFRPSTFYGNGGSNIWDAAQQSEITARMLANGQAWQWSCA
jgi:hypothetical protein